MFLRRWPDLCFDSGLLQLIARQEVEVEWQAGEAHNDKAAPSEG